MNNFQDHHIFSNNLYDNLNIIRNRQLKYIKEDDDIFTNPRQDATSEKPPELIWNPETNQWEKPVKAGDYSTRTVDPETGETTFKTVNTDDVKPFKPQAIETFLDQIGIKQNTEAGKRLIRLFSTDPAKRAEAVKPYKEFGKELTYGGWEEAAKKAKEAKAAEARGEFDLAKQLESEAKAARGRQLATYGRAAVGLPAAIWAGRQAQHGTEDLQDYAYKLMYGEDPSKKTKESLLYRLAPSAANFGAMEVMGTLLSLNPLDPKLRTLVGLKNVGGKLTGALGAGLVGGALAVPVEMGAHWLGSKAREGLEDLTVTEKEQNAATRKAIEKLGYSRVPKSSNEGWKAYIKAMSEDPSSATSLAQSMLDIVKDDKGNIISVTPKKGMTQNERERKTQRWHENLEDMSLAATEAARSEVLPGLWDQLKRLYHMALPGETEKEKNEAARSMMQGFSITP